MNWNTFLCERVEVDFLIGMLREREHIQESFERDTLLAKWQAIRELAMYHGVMPILYRSLGDLALQLPSEEVCTLKSLYQSTSRDQLALTAHLLTLTGRLESRGLHYVAIKGPALSQEVYGDITLRQYGDIDLFVDQDDMQEMSELIIGLGYQPLLPVTLLTRRKFFALDNDFSFRHQSSGVLLELHWKLFPRRHRMSLPFEQLYAHAGRLDIQNRKITILSPEDNLLYLTLHGAKHIFERFEWVYDIDRLIDTYPDLDLRKVYEKAVAIRVEEPFLLGIFLCELLFGTPIPQSLQRYRSERVDQLIESVLHYCKEEFIFWDEAAKKRARFLFLAQLHQEKESPLFSHFKSLFKPTAVDVITFSLSDRIDFLYPLLRPFRLFYKYFLRRLYPL